MKTNNITNKIGLLCIKDKKLLIVHKSTIGLYITPGGKIEANETDKECLSREIEEELGCGIKNLTRFHTFKRINAQGITLKQKCYLGQLKGKITLNSNDNIDDYLWIDRSYRKMHIKLGPMLKYQIIPKLIKGGLL